MAKKKKEKVAEVIRFEAARQAKELRNLTPGSEEFKLASEALKNTAESYATIEKSKNRISWDTIVPAGFSFVSMIIGMIFSTTHIFDRNPFTAVQQSRSIYKQR